MAWATAVVGALAIGTLGVGLWVFEGVGMPALSARVATLSL